MRTLQVEWCMNDTKKIINRTRSDTQQFALHVQPMKKRYLFCQDRFVNKATSKGYLHKSKSPRSKENDLMSCLNNQVIILRISFRSKTLPQSNRKLISGGIKVICTTITNP